MEWFLSRGEAKVVIEAWRREYNEGWPRSSLGQLTPNEFINQLSRGGSLTAILKLQLFRRNQAGQVDSIMRRICTRRMTVPGHPLDWEALPSGKAARLV